MRDSWRFMSGRQSHTTECPTAIIMTIYKRNLMAAIGDSWRYGATMRDSWRLFGIISDFRLIFMIWRVLLVEHSRSFTAKDLKACMTFLGFWWNVSFRRASPNNHLLRVAPWQWIDVSGPQITSISKVIRSVRKRRHELWKHTSVGTPQAVEDSRRRTRTLPTVTDQEYEVWNLHKIGSSLRQYQSISSVFFRNYRFRWKSPEYVRQWMSFTKSK